MNLQTRGLMGVMLICAMSLIFTMLDSLFILEEGIEEQHRETWNAIWERANLLPIENGEKKLTRTNKTSYGDISTLTSMSLNNTLMAAKGEKNLFKMDAKRLFETFPPPLRTETIRIYNKEAYHDLIKMFTSKEGEIRICANGGSSTAGGGNVGERRRFYVQLGRYIRELNLNASGGEIQLIHRGHGSRNSFHSAVFAPNFLPPNTDLLFWEFSINDNCGSNIPDQTCVGQQRSMFIAWLREVEQMRPQPPKVILVYLWQSPFQFNEQGQVDNPVYKAHAQIAENFDFVVGHVNLASYFDELSMVSFESSKELFLFDKHHPNSVGHLLITFLLLNLLRGKGEWSDFNIRSEKSSSQRALSKVRKQGWFCGNETESKRLVQSLIVGDSNTSSGWRSPLGTLTLQEPQNPVVSGSRQLILDMESAYEIKIVGKANPLRRDRQRSIPVPCCTDNSNCSLMTMRVPADTKPIQRSRGMLFGFAPGNSSVTNLRVSINSDSNNANGTLIKVPSSWPCLWSWTSNHYLMYESMWFVFTEEQLEISSMHLCVENDQCEDSGQSNALIMFTAVY